MRAERSSPTRKLATTAPRLAASAILVLAVLASPGSADAQDYPTRPVKLVVPFPPGGPLDIVGRAIAQKLTEAWSQSVVVDNRPGAGGNIGADIVAKSPPDGYTILMGALSTHAVNPSLYAKMPYDAVKDFAPITLVAVTPNVLVVNAALPVNSAEEFVALAKANPGKLAFGSGSNGSAGHLAGELFKVEREPTWSMSRTRAARRRCRRCSRATRSSCSTTWPTRWRR
jgi:tripartite-type tricarboxylate transporter receptor subunit TctC